MWDSAVGCLVTLILSLLAAPLAAEARQPAKVPRIGILITGTASTSEHNIEAFRQGLRALGYVEGQNIVLVLGLSLPAQARLRQWLDEHLKHIEKRE